MKKSRLILIILSVLVLLGCIGMTGYLLFSNYQNVRLFKQAQENFQQGDEASLALAENQLLQIIRSDSENESAFIMLGEIARRKKVHSEQVYYCYMAYRLNPLSGENKEKYIESLCFARYFERLETLLAQDSSRSDRNDQLLLYVAGRNGTINKYKSRYQTDHSLRELAFLLFKDSNVTAAQKLSALEKISAEGDAFLEQELLVAKTELYLELQEIDHAEKVLQKAYALNEYAFAPVLGRFYASYRNLGKALEVFEKHLSVYHDQSVAMQTAEIYCLLNQTEKIAALRKDYQSDSGSRAMLCNYYFDALIALAKKDMASVRDHAAPLRKNINTPLSAFLFFCADIHANDLTAILNSYKALTAYRNYLNLQEQADHILSEYLKKAYSGKRANDEKLLSLATVLHSRKPEAFTAKLILLAQKKTGSVNVVLLKDSLKRFGNDPGVLKIAIEYYLLHELAEAERLIALFKRNFAQKSGEMLRYEIILNYRKKEYDKVSDLFRNNCTPEMLPEYWTFASSTMRENDLQFLSRAKFYGPFSKALLLIKAGKSGEACDLLEKADAGNNSALLFFAAKILAENGRNQAALKKYALIPQDSSYGIAVLLNMAELYSEIGDLDQALILANRAYSLAPQMPETQLCYAEKLYKKGNLNTIPDVIKLTSNTYRRRMEPLWVAGMQQRIKDCDISTQREKIRELCRQLLVISPDNNIALEYLKKLHQMPQ